MKNQFFLMWSITLLLTLFTAQASGQKVTGRVIDKDGTTLPYASINVKESPLGVITDKEGHFHLLLPQTGTYTFEVRYTGFITNTQTCLISQDTTLQFKMKESILNLDEITVTGTRTPKMLKDAPVITRLITTRDLKRFNAATIKDVLETELPGMEFSQQESGGTTINIQGLGGKYILFLVDGERMAGEFYGNIDYNRLNIDNIKQIEIIKGGASALYGSNAVGGVINIITKEVEKPLEAHAGASYGSLNEQRYTTSFGFKHKKISSLTSMVYKQKDSYSLTDTTGEKTYIEGGHDLSFDEKLTWSPSEKFNFIGKGSYYSRSVNNSQNILLKDHYRDYGSTAKAKWSLATNQDLTFSYDFDQYKKYDYYTQRTANSSELNYKDTQHTGRALHNLTINKGNILTTGAEYFYDELYSNQFDGSSHSVNSQILFAQHDYNITPKLNVVYGTRLDYYSSFGTYLSPKISLMYKLSPITLRTAYSRGFKAPSLKEMYSDYDISGAGWLFLKGNPDLETETSDNVSLSFEYTKTNLNFSLLGSYTNLHNKIAGIFNPREMAIKYINADHSSVGSIDAYLTLNLSHGFMLKSAYGYTHEVLKEEGVNLSSTRPHTATVGLNYAYSHKNYHLNCAINGRWMSQLKTNEQDEKSKSGYLKVNYPGYQLWKMTITQTFYNKYHLRLSMDNIFDYQAKIISKNAPISNGTTVMAGLAIDLL